MLMKSITAAALGSALLATTALAQTTAPTTTAPMTTTSSAATPSSYDGNWRTSKVVGLNVYNDGKESLGEINDLLTDRSGKIVAAVIGVGGFLGVGERYVAIPFEKVKFVNEPMVSPKTAETGGTMPGASRPTPATTTTGAAVGATAPLATPATAKSNPWYPDHAVISATKDELKSLPEFKYTTN